MKIISPSISPNTQKDDVILALSGIFKFWEYKKGSNNKSLEDWFCSFFKVSYAISFNSARASLFAILNACNLKKEDEVILQAFTCTVVPNAVIASGATPIYVDMNNSFTIDTNDLEKKISKNTKVIIIQHTFGISSNMDDILKIAKRNNILAIEDVAHTIGGEYKNKKLGTLGDAAIFSFGRDKAFSSVFGGIVITNNKILGEKIKNFQKESKYPSNFWIFQQLFHPIAFSIILPLYNFFSLGKILLVFFQKLNLLSFPVSTKEKKGKFSIDLIKRFPDALSRLALLQLSKISLYNNRRKEIAAKYKKVCTDLKIETEDYKDSFLLRFPILIKDPIKMYEFFRKEQIHLGNWYSNIFDPKGIEYSVIFYKKGSCPNAEKIAQKIVNLPMNPTLTDKDLNKVINTLKNYVSY